MTTSSSLCLGALVFVSLGLAGCGLATAPGSDAATDAASSNDAASLDAPVLVDAPRIDAPTCSCRSGGYHVVSSSSSVFVSYDIDVQECGGSPVCRIGSSPSTLQPTTCMMTADGAFRVYVDSVGTVQLLFMSTPCDADWTGLYASEGGGQASIVATRE